MLRHGAVIAEAAMVMIALVQGLRPPVVTHHEVVLPDLPAQLDGTTMVVISDLHLGAAIGRDWFAARVEQIRALRPDLVVMLKIPAFPAMLATKSAKGEDNAAGKN